MKTKISHSHFLTSKLNAKFLFLCHELNIIRNKKKSLNVELIEWELVVFLLKQLIHFNDKYQPMSR